MMQDILTETEAKTRWCPMVRAPDDGANVDSVDGRDVRVGRCIAGECMAWRLAHKDSANGEERGYCGAFGLPRFT